MDDSDRTMIEATPRRRARDGRRDGLFQRNGWWWLDYYDAEGRRHRKKAAPDYQTARMLYRETMTAIAKGEVLGIREEGIRLGDFIERRYWPTVKATLSLDEMKRARIILDKQILPTFGGVKLSKLRREEIERWQSDRLAEVSSGTANKELMRFKHLLNRAVAWGYLKDTPAKAIKKLKEAPGRVRYLSPEELVLLEGASPTLRPVIVAALQTGGRRGSLLELRWSDIDMRARTITFRRTKNGERHVIPMTDTMRETLQTLPRPLDPEVKVFPSWTREALTVAFGRLTKTLGIDNLRFHDLRHHVASTLTMAGVPQRTVMEILAHRDPRMTLRYQHLTPGHLRDAMRALNHPPQQNSADTAGSTSPMAGPLSAVVPVFDAQ